MPRMKDPIFPHCLKCNKKAQPRTSERTLSQADSQRNSLEQIFLRGIGV